ncbi:conserved hypothetical protein [Candidatus Terasakiella magnetica]|nr:conserved hypothetical protein [Candidatus Terasakiella magnetica]
MRRWLVAFCLLAAPAASETVLKDGDVLRGRFVQERHLTGFAAPLRSAGSFVIAPGRGLIWRAETPFPITTVVSPAGLLQSVGGTETTRLPAQRLPFLTRLYDMMAGALAGDWRALEGSFQVMRQGAAIKLSPLGGDDPAASQIAGITAKLGQFVDEVEIAKPGGDFDRLTFLDQSLGGGPLGADDAALLERVGK